MYSDKPRGLGKRAWFLTRLYRSLLIGLAKFKVFNVTVHNRAAVPKSGAAIIASNHISIADPVFLWGAVRRNAVAMAMAELWKTPFINWVLLSLDHIPVVRGDRVSGAKASEASERVLEHGGVLIIFPEGKCSADDRLLAFKPGVATIAWNTGAPIIPVGITGTNQVKPLRSRRINRRAHVDVRFGAALYAKDFATKSELLAAVETSISKLSGRPRATAQ